MSSQQSTVNSQQPAERPILFQTEMVKAILEGRKNNTRRTKGLSLNVEGKPKEDWIYTECFLGSDLKGNDAWMALAKHVPTGGTYADNCPYGKPGDLLWVKETTKVGAWNNEHFKVAFDYKASPELKKTPWVEFQYTDEFEDFQIKLLEKLDRLGVDPVIDEENEVYQYRWEPGQSPFKWTPSMHMPKKAARLWLMIEDIRVERVQNISKADAIAEGILPIDQHGIKVWKRYDDYNTVTSSPTVSFWSLWASINGEESWQSNPWVWVIQFRVLSTTGKPSDEVIHANYKEVRNG